MTEGVGDSEKISKVTDLNAAFRQGKTAYDVLAVVRSFGKPIVVDFNNVLANNRDPFVVNPEAEDFLDALRKIGDVFIVTTAYSWDDVHDFMIDNGLWRDDVILMTMPSWNFLTQHEFDGNSDKARQLRAEYIQKMKDQGISVEEHKLIKPPAAKNLAPLFNKTFDVPIVDDLARATRNNPGMLGLNVKTFEPADNDVHETGNTDKLSLGGAAKLIEEHYSKLAL